MSETQSLEYWGYTDHNVTVSSDTSYDAPYKSDIDSELDYFDFEWSDGHSDESADSNLLLLDNKPDGPAGKANFPGDGNASVKKAEKILPTIPTALTDMGSQALPTRAFSAEPSTKSDTTLECTTEMASGTTLTVLPMLHLMVVKSATIFNQRIGVMTLALKILRICTTTGSQIVPKTTSKSKGSLFRHQKTFNN